MISANSNLPPLHDGLLLGVLVKHEEARIFVQAESGATFTLVLLGVKRFHAEGFAEGNIIFDCEILTKSEIPSDLLALLNHGGTREAELVQLRDSVADGTYRFFSVVPSYGATVVALIKELTVEAGIVVF